MRKSTITLAVTITALGMTALAGCGSSSSPSTSAGGTTLEKTDIKVGGLPLADYATVYWAEDKGFFQKEGLNVTIVPLQGGPVGVQEVAAGQLDFSFTNPISSSIAQSKGVPVETVVLASSLGTHEMGIFVKPTSPIKTMSDLNGKSVGVNTTANVGDVTFGNLAKSEGLSVTPNWVEVPFNEMVDGVESGSIDAGFVPEPYKSQAEQAGLREVTDLATGPNAGLPMATFIASNSFVKNDPNTVNAFVTAMYDANKDIQAHISEFRSWLPGVAGVDPKTAQSMVLPVFSDSTDIAGLSKVADMLKAQGLLPSSFDVNKYTYVPQS